MYIGTMAQKSMYVQLHHETWKYAFFFATVIICDCDCEAILIRGQKCSPDRGIYSDFVKN